MFSGRFRSHRLPDALVLAIAAEGAVRDEVRSRQRGTERKAAAFARADAEYQKTLAERLRLSRIPAAPHLAARMPLAMYEAAIAARQRDREAAGVNRRIGDNRIATGPSSRADWLAEKQRIEAMAVRFRERMAEHHRRATGCNVEGCDAVKHGSRAERAEREARIRLVGVLTEHLKARELKT
jgi:hypothetical protein